MIHDNRIVYVYGVGVVMFMTNMIVYMYLPDCQTAQISYIDNAGDIVSVEGGRDFVRNISLYLKWAKENPVEIPAEYVLVWNPPTTIHTTTTSSTTTTSITIPCPPCETCPDCECTCPICPTCPDPGRSYDAGQEKEVLGLRPRGGEAPIFQRGFFEAKKRLLHILDIGDLKYTEGPSTGASSLIYKPPVNDTFCFRNIDNGFLLNRTPDMQGRKRWGWNDESCKSSVLRINHL